MADCGEAPTESDVRSSLFGYNQVFTYVDARAGVFISESSRRARAAALVLESPLDKHAPRKWRAAAAAGAWVLRLMRPCDVSTGEVAGARMVPGESRRRCVGVCSVVGARVH